MYPALQPVGGLESAGFDPWRVEWTKLDNSIVAVCACRVFSGRFRSWPACIGTSISDSIIYRYRNCEKWILAQRNTPSHAHVMTNRLDTLSSHARARARRTPPTGVDTEQPPPLPDPSPPPPLPERSGPALRPAPHRLPPRAATAAGPALPGPHAGAGGSLPPPPVGGEGEGGSLDASAAVTDKINAKCDSCEKGCEA